MKILIIHPGESLESLWATARAAVEFGTLHIVLAGNHGQILAPANLGEFHIYAMPGLSLTACMHSIITDPDSPKFDLAVIGCTADNSSAGLLDQQAAAIEAYRHGISALSAVILSQPGQRLFEQSIQYSIERLLRNVLLVQTDTVLAVDVHIPNLHPNLLSGFSLLPSGGSSFVSINSLIGSSFIADSLVNSMGSRHAYEEANRVREKAKYHFKGALLADQGIERELPPAGGGVEIQPYEISMLRHAMGRVLDVGCGDGRIATYLMRPKQRKTLWTSEIVGIDTTPNALQILNERFLEESLPPCTTCFGDFLFDEWQHLGGFDTILLCGNNFGIASNYDQLVELLLKVKALARPGCQLIGSSRHPQHSTTPAYEYAISCKNVERGFRAGERWLRFTYQNHDSGWVPWYYVSPQELEQAARISGWRLDCIVYEANKDPVETLDFAQFETKSKSDEYGAVLSIRE